MKTLFALSVLLLSVMLQISIAADNPPPNCKPLTYMGVSGCELLPDRTCPKGYHVEAVGPANPQMKAPSRLMCVADKPDKKPAPQKGEPKPEPKAARP